VNALSISPPKGNGDAKAPAPAAFLGWQEDTDGAAFELFVLTAGVGAHPAGSTVCRFTLERFGYFVPASAVIDRTLQEHVEADAIEKSEHALWGLMGR